MKIPVFSISKLDRVEISLGPEMKSTGEVLGVGETLEEALFKGLLASVIRVNDGEIKVLATINYKDKSEFIKIAKIMINENYKIFATSETRNLLVRKNIKSEKVKKVHEKGEKILDLIRNKEIDLVINTPTKGSDKQRDGFLIRRNTVEYGIYIITSLYTLKAIIKIKQSHIKGKKSRNI